MGDTNAVGRIAARIDRLPLTWAQWRLALISQLFWGVIIAADGIPAKDTAGEFALAAHQTRADPNFMRHHEAPEGYFAQAGR